MSSSFIRQRRDLPQVSLLAGHASLAGFSTRVRTEAARRAIEEARTVLASGEEVESQKLASRAFEIATRGSAPTLRSAINMSGVILHTGLGRARLGPAAIRSLVEVASGHCTLEFDLETGGRGDRQTHVHDVLCELTGAEAALVVNNAAAGVVLALAALAGGKDVVLSRGEMVEIGGSFRMPEIVGESGCDLIEVGCTNKTRLSDYRKAIRPNTGAVLLCHPSNFRITGFTEKPALSALAALCGEKGLWLIDDLGSGCMVDTTRFGLSGQPTVAERIAGGAHVVVSSGDKLLGGPQAGIMVGRADAIEKCARHPLARAFRVDKLTLAALGATLDCVRGERLDEIPTLRYLGRPLVSVRRMCARFKRAFPGVGVVERGLTEIGGGSAPGEGVPTFRAGLRSSSPDRLAAWLRSQSPHVVGRIERDLVWLDPRTCEVGEVRAVCRMLREVPVELL